MVVPPGAVPALVVPPTALEVLRRVEDFVVVELGAGVTKVVGEVTVVDEWVTGGVTTVVLLVSGVVGSTSVLDSQPQRVATAAIAANPVIILVLVFSGIGFLLWNETVSDGVRVKCYPPEVVVLVPTVELALAPPLAPVCVVAEVLLLEPFAPGVMLMPLCVGGVAVAGIEEFGVEVDRLVLVTVL